MSTKRWVAAGIAVVIAALAVGWLLDVAMQKPWNPVSDLVVGVLSAAIANFAVNAERRKGDDRG